MLAGDDELNAILAEMGGGGVGILASATSSTTTIPKNHRERTAELHENSRFQDPTRWPKQFQLKESFGAGICPKWKNSSSKKSTMDVCEECALSRSFHRMTITPKKKKKPAHLLLKLFCHVRNIRCLSSENTCPSLAVYRTIIHKMLEILEDTKQSIRLSSTDHETIHEKITDLQLQVNQTSSLKQNHWKDDLEWRLNLIMKADKLYYRIYYACLTSSSSPSSATDSNETPSELLIPHPHTYFACPGLAWKVSTRETQELVQELDQSTRSLLVDTMGLLSDHPTNYNPLHALWQHRFYEMVRHFWTPQPSRTTTTILQALALAKIRPGNMHAQFAQHETLAPTVMLADWRDVARDFPASLYAYATPSPLALKQLASVLKDFCVVEMGAGTGYWAALLQQQYTIDIAAYDISPPGSFSENEYHSEVPAFTTILPLDTLDTGRALSVLSTKTTSRSSSSSPKKMALFLCYPPPGTDMALSALQAFGGEMVVHVGEWAGLTANAGFEEALAQSFVCQQQLTLPIWGTDAAYMTIWKRRRTNGISSNNNPATGGCIACGDIPAIRLCRYARLIQYCSEACFDAHSVPRKSLLMIHMICIGDQEDICWSSQQDFMPLTAATGNGDEASSSKENYRRKKKRRKK